MSWRPSLKHLARRGHFAKIPGGGCPSVSIMCKKWSSSFSSCGISVSPETCKSAFPVRNSYSRQPKIQMSISYCPARSVFLSLRVVLSLCITTIVYHAVLASDYHHYESEFTWFPSRARAANWNCQRSKRCDSSCGANAGSTKITHTYHVRTIIVLPLSR